MVQDFKEALHYPVEGKPKTVYYFLAELKDPCAPVKLSDEHINYQWANLEQSKLLSGTYTKINDVLDKAEQHLNS